MASSINASTSGGGGVITTADATGNLDIQSGGSTIVAVTSTGAAVTGTLAATGTTNLGALTTTGNTILGDASTDTLNVGNGGLVKDASGNVGIGTASPSTYSGSNLVSFYAGGNNFAGLTSINSNTGTGIGGIQFGSDTTYVKAAIGLVRQNANGNGSLVFYNDSNADAANWSTGDEKMRIDSSGNLLFNSGYGSAATAYGCRAWVNFNGTGTVAIRASGNVSSITDNSVGNYTVNFTTAMPDANYAITDGIGATVGDYGSDIIFFTFTTSAVSFAVVNRTPAYTDFSTLCISVFR